MREIFLQEKICNEPFELVPFVEEIDRLGLQFYKDDGPYLFWGHFLLSQMSYRNKMYPLPCPNHLVVASPDTNLNVLRLFQVAQGLVDSLLHPYDPIIEPPFIENLKKAVHNFERSPKSKVDRAKKRDDIWSGLCYFPRPERRPLGTAYTPEIGVLHDGTGYVQLTVNNERDQRVLIAQLRQPTWIKNPWGLFVKNTEPQAVDVVFDGSVSVSALDQLASQSLLEATTPFLLTVPPLTEKRWSDAELDAYLEQGCLLNGYGHAARMQLFAAGIFKKQKCTKMIWPPANDRYSAEYMAEFWIKFGTLSTLPDEQRHFLAQTWTYLRMAASYFTEGFQSWAGDNGPKNAKAIRNRFEAGVDQLIVRHIKVLTYLRIGPEFLSELESRILVYFRKNFAQFSGREIQRNLSLPCSKARDQALEKLEAMHIVQRAKRAWFAVPLGVYCERISLNTEKLSANSELETSPDSC